jgi:hypothetical protein
MECVRMRCPLKERPLLILLIGWYLEERPLLIDSRVVLCYISFN